MNTGDYRKLGKLGFRRWTLFLGMLLFVGPFAWFLMDNFLFFPSKHEVDVFIKQYAVRPHTDGSRHVKSFLDRLQALDIKEHDEVMLYTLDELAKYYLKSHDESILVAIEAKAPETDGSFAVGICYNFYNAVFHDPVFQERFQNNPGCREVVTTCCMSPNDCIDVSPEEAQRLGIPPNTVLRMGPEPETQAISASAAKDYPG